MEGIYNNVNFFFLNACFPLRFLNDRALYVVKAPILTNVPSLLAG